MSTELIGIPKESWPRPEDLPGDLPFIAQGLEEYYPGKGMELTLMIARIFRGLPLYIHNIDKLLRDIRNEAIRDDYDNGMSVKKLAVKYKLSTRQIENILSSPSSQDELKKKQYTLW